MAKDESRGVKTARSGIVYNVGQIAASIAVLATLAILARLLMPIQFGLYSIVIAFYTFFGMLGNFSIGAAVRKKMVEQKDIEGKRRLVSSAYKASFTISLLVALFGILISTWASMHLYHQPSLIVPLMMVSVLIVFWAIFNLTLATLVAFDLVKEATFIDIVYAIVQLFAAPLLVILGYGIDGAIVGLGIGIILGTALGLYYMFKKIRHLQLEAKVSDKTTTEVVRFATPVYASYLVMQGIYSFAILLLGTMVGAATVANYNIGYELGGFVSIILTSNMFILLPAFSSMAAAQKSKKKIGDALNHSIYYTVVFLAPLVAYVASVSKPVVFLLFSHAYPNAPIYLTLVAIGLTLGVIWNYASTIMLGMGDIRRFLKFQALSAVIELALLFGLTPTFKVAGLIAGLFVIFPIAMDAIYINELRGSISFAPKLKKPAIIATTALIVFIFLYLTSFALGGGYITILANLVVAAVIYPPMLAHAGGISRKDLAFMSKTLGKRSISRPLLAMVNYTQRFVPV